MKKVTQKTKQQDKKALSDKIAEALTPGVSDVIRKQAKRWLKGTIPTLDELKAELEVKLSQHFQMQKVRRQILKAVKEADQFGCDDRQFAVGGKVSKVVAETILKSILDSVVATIATAGMFAQILLPLIALGAVSAVGDGGKVVYAKLSKVRVPKTVRVFLISEKKIDALVSDKAEVIRQVISKGL